jgi:hypothetical protein
MKNIFRWISRKLRRAPATQPTPRADYNFFNLGIQYYVVARFSAIAGLIPVSGNQYHHAVEMLLKGQLAKTESLEIIKRKYSHGLKRTWKDFKKLFPAEDMSPFDDLIRELARFERIRYPDNVLKEGMSATLAWHAPKTPTKVAGSAKKVPHYEFAVTDLDQLIGTLFRLCSMNPVAYLGRLNEHGFKVLERDNPAFTGWFPEWGKK